jgi:hypothetical protein
MERLGVCPRLTLPPPSPPSAEPWDDIFACRFRVHTPGYAQMTQY